MCPDAVLVAVDGCVTFVPLHKSHPPPSLHCIYLHCETMWLGVSDFIREVWTCTLEHGCLVQGQTLCPKTRAKCEWRKMDTSGSCVVTASHHHISQWLVSARQPAHPIQQVGTERVKVVSYCLHIHNFPFKCSSFTTLIKRKWSIGVLGVSSCFILAVSHKNKWTYPSILITSPWVCCTILKMFNCQWGIGSWTEADQTTRSSQSITHSFQIVNILHV